MTTSQWVQEHAEDAYEHLIDAEESFVKETRHFMSDFVDFIDEGNVLELATGIMLGGAFSTIVSSLVDDILSPPIGLIVGRNFENAFFVIKHGLNDSAEYQTVLQAQEDGAVTLNLGNFMQNILSFVFIGFSLFIIVRIAEKALHSDVIKQKKRCKFCRQRISLKAKKCQFCCAWLDPKFKDLDVKRVDTALGEN